MKNEWYQNADGLIDAALQEDLGTRGDITSLAILSPESMCSANVIAKQTGVICGTEIVKRVFQRIDGDIEININIQDGDPVKKHDVIMSLSGRTRSVLQAERTALNFLGRLSGIATLTRKYVKAISHTRAKCLDTRKTTPGWRRLEKYAVACGGGTNHRMGLYDMFLIKENHILAAGSMAEAVNRCREYMQNHNIQAAIVVETRNLAEMKIACSLSVDRIMLDNMNLQDMSECVNFVDNRIQLEASGNVSIDNIADISESGVDYISVGALTHSAGTFDTSLLLESV